MQQKYITTPFCKLQAFFKKIFAGIQIVPPTVSKTPLLRQTRVRHSGRVRKPAPVQHIVQLMKFLQMLPFRSCNLKKYLVYYILYIYAKGDEAMLLAILRGGVTSVWDFLFLLAGYLLLLGVTMPLHEAAHAFTAYKLGDPTARNVGRLTLNPLAHYDPIGSTMILLFGIGYAKAVPVNPRYFRNPKGGMALTALAGPLSNLLMAFACLALFRGVASLGGGVTVEGNYFLYQQEYVYYAYMALVAVLARVNIALAVFNLLPIPPLDGSRIFGALLPDKWTWWMDRYHEIVRMAVLVLIVTGALDRPLSFLTGAVGNGMCWLLRLPNLI